MFKACLQYVALYLKAKKKHENENLFTFRRDDPLSKEQKIVKWGLAFISKQNI